MAFRLKFDVEGEDFSTFITSVAQQPIFDGLPEVLVYTRVLKAHADLLEQDPQRFISIGTTMIGTREVWDFTIDFRWAL